MPNLCLPLLSFLQIADLAEVARVASIDLLRSLNLRGNPVREMSDYRLSVIFAVQQLTELDTQHIDVAEKVCLLKSGFHYPSTQAVLTGDRFPLAELTGRFDGPC